MVGNEVVVYLCGRFLNAAVKPERGVEVFTKFSQPLGRKHLEAMGWKLYLCPPAKIEKSRVLYKGFTRDKTVVLSRLLKSCQSEKKFCREEKST